MSSLSKDSPVVNPCTFYWLASWLNTHRPEPASPELCRAIVGRAYYAAFLAARDAAKVAGSGAKIHGDVISYWKQRDSFVSNKLRELKRLREQADYELHTPVGARDVDNSLKGCRAVLAKLNPEQTNNSDSPEGYSPVRK